MISDYRKNLIKEGNESTFLPKNEQVKFHSIILLEIFNFEDFPNLIKGLDKLYADLDTQLPIFSDQVDEVKNGLKNPVEPAWFWHNLPSIFNSNAPSLFGASFDLGSNFSQIELGLYWISSSLIVMQISARLNFEVSDELNKLIYKEYTDDELTIRHPDGGGSRFFPEGLKTTEITDLRLKLKKEVIDYLSNFFEGQFFKLSENDYSIVPSIDIYSLDYPENTEDILKWGQEVSGFLQCFGVSLDEYVHSRTSLYNQYILCEEETKFKDNEFKHPNHIILVNNRFFKSEEENGIDLMGTPDTPFCILAINRLSNIHKDILGELNATISNEIQNLEKNELIDVLENRKKISKKIYYFKRFKIEFEQIPHTEQINFNFSSMARNKEEQYDLFDFLFDQIRKQTNNIDDAIDTLNQHSNLILNLKNIEYSRNMQISTKNLSILVVIFTGIVVFLTLFTLWMTFYR
jgi:hypothetical protein